MRVVIFLQLEITEIGILKGRPPLWPRMREREMGRRAAKLGLGDSQADLALRYSSNFYTASLRRV